MLEEKLIIELQNYKGKVVFVKGIIASHQSKTEIDNITFYNFMQSNELEKTINESALLLCRSGYTTIMDLAKLEKKVFFIPTPGQFEQEYLAKKFKKQGLVPMAKQDKFKIEDLFSVPLYQGLPKIKSEINWKELFSLFQE